ncbi:MULTISPECIES: DEAD/DEAH box helicase [unclassified Dietzia]|uniref:DEAD/DEAH box helicase n=1 Tax=unclassified Dietzia TaxID=2617939 RepID=UPI0015F8CF22|nr:MULTISPECIES: DEAD/DEAH box helicase [unclassified Dietzia]MBB1052993.1 DEAD/DEAH box helicase [Dietzia sp. B44]MBB1057175.1 DEAD/DEAH box helicase [Dietzia sp. B19]
MDHRAPQGFPALHPLLQHHVVNSLGWPGLRPLQEESVRPLIAGEDALLLAPTAGGKTEAAVFPVLTRMAHEDWAGLTVLYVTPLKALLNNLAVRLVDYTAWMGRRVEVWHGDVGESARRAIRADPPDILLTTPESIEAMLASTKTDHRTLFANLRTVVIDEVHAFAGDDRGWHLSAVLSRLEHLVGRPLQRIGMSATVGNPEELLRWLQGGVDGRAGRVIAPGVAVGEAVRPVAGDADIVVDAVDTLDSAAVLLSKLYRGQKRLVFVDSRRQAEELASMLRGFDVDVYLSHSSLSAEERRRSELAFAEARDCVIVATSTLELGIDIGDLDRMIQIGAPTTVSSFLQRLGRTGRRAGTVRNCLFIATEPRHLLRTLGLLHAWGSGYVEPVVPPPVPLHLVAQQIMAAMLQEGALPRYGWQDRWAATPLMHVDTLERPAELIVDFLVERGYLNVDGGALFLGPDAERVFGRRHFMDLLTTFAMPREFTVLAGRQEVGTVEWRALTSGDGPIHLLLAGRSWKVTDINWPRHRVQVEPAAGGGRARYGFGGADIGRQVAQGMRAVLLGELPEQIRLTARARASLAVDEERLRHTVSHHGPVWTTTDNVRKWWTYEGSAANRRYQAALGSALGEELAPQGGIVQPDAITLYEGMPTAPAAERLEFWESLPESERPLPAVPPTLIDKLKFSEALPVEWAIEVIARRMGYA